MPSNAPKREANPSPGPLPYAPPASADEARKADLRVRPLKPRPALLAVTSVIFALWVGFLVALYFKTDHPRRSTAPRPDASGAVLTDPPSESPR